MDYKFVDLAEQEGKKFLTAGKPKSCNGFIFPVDSSNKEAEKLAAKSLTYSAMAALATYMTPTVIYRGNDEELQTSSNIRDNDEWMHSLVVVASKMGDLPRIRSRIETPSYAATIIVFHTERLRDHPEISSTPFMIMLADVRSRTVTMVTYDIHHNSLTGEVYGYNPLGTAYIYEDKYNAAKDIYTAEKEIFINGALPNRIVQAVRQCIWLSSTNLGQDTSTCSFPTYKREEVRMFQRMLTLDIPERLKPLICDIGGYSTNDRIDLSPLTFREFEEIIPEAKQDSDWSKYPEIDLSEKEMKFVEKYVMQHDAELYPMNLISLLENSRFDHGRIGLMANEDQTIKIDILYTWRIDRKHNLVRFYIIERPQAGVSVIAVIDFIDCDKFTLKESFALLKVIVYFEDPSKAIYSGDQLPNLSAMTMIKPLGFIEAFMRILSIHIVMRDRPKRTKMVKCTEKRRVQRDPRNKAKGYVEKEYVVSRILKSDSDARDYVNSMGATGERHFEYVLEEWERASHPRHLKSGKVIQVRTTTCHRHKDLTKKEIKIKL